MTKLTNYKTFTFGDDYTRQDYEIKKNYFISVNRTDVYQDFTYGIELIGFKNKILIEAEKGAKPERLSLTHYVWATLCMFTICYRMWFQSISSKKEFVYNKSIKTLPPNMVVIQPLVVNNPVPNNVIPSNNVPSNQMINSSVPSAPMMKNDTVYEESSGTQKNKEDTIISLTNTMNTSTDNTDIYATAPTMDSNNDFNAELNDEITDDIERPPAYDSSKLNPM